MPTHQTKTGKCKKCGAPTDKQGDCYEERINDAVGALEHLFGMKLIKPARIQAHKNAVMIAKNVMAKERDK